MGDDISDVKWPLTRSRMNLFLFKFNAALFFDLI